MSACDRIRPLLLEAELTELRGEGDGELARHVRECARCRAAASRVAALTDALGTVLAQPTGGVDVEAVVRRAALEARDGDGRAARTGSRKLRVWAGLAAAAAIAAVLLLPGGDTEPPRPPTRTAEAARPAVEVAEGANVVVIPTQDPEITVVWFF